MRRIDRPVFASSVPIRDNIFVRTGFVGTEAGQPETVGLDAAIKRVVTIGANATA